MSPNATALESIKCTLGGTTLSDPYNLRAWPTDSKAGRYFVCYNTAVTLQSTPNARSAEGKASPPSAPAVAGTYRRTGARKPHFSERWMQSPARLFMMVQDHHKMPATRVLDHPPIPTVPKPLALSDKDFQGKPLAPWTIPRTPLAVAVSG